jgi:hypothetical protein
MIAYRYSSIGRSGTALTGNRIIRVAGMLLKKQNQMNV